MSYKAKVLEVLIASPSDVVQERKIIQEIIHSWNSINSKELEVVLLPVMWETHSTPEMGDRPQAIINEQIVTSCDILVGAFWTRIGTHTGIAESGTIEEIQQFIDKKRPTMLYFSSAPVVMDSVDLEQYNKLLIFKKKCLGEGIVEQYSSISEFREKLSNHLTRVVRKYFKNDEDEVAEDIYEESKQVEITKEQFRAIVTRQLIEWTTERDSHPHNIDGGKAILRNLGNYILELRVLFNDKVSTDLTKSMENVLKEIKALQRHMLFLDGGKSFREFWQSGDEVFEELNRIVNSFEIA